MTSCFPTALEGQLCYRRLKGRDLFLQALSEGSVELKNYEIFQVQFEP